MSRDSAGKILQAYADLLVEQGDRGATVDAVAARCGLSKAGLLHHYRSKASLNQALFEELEVQAAEDVRRLQLDPPSAISSYITSSLEVEPAGTPHSGCLSPGSGRQ